ncbi:MAG: ribose 5-phosphate isomerase B [Chloroflexota bacterium]
MRIAIGCDHRGLEVKQAIMKWLDKTAHNYTDFGTYTADSVDYPDIAGKVGLSVASGEDDCGILICDTGIGMSIAANKVKGIRAARCVSVFDAERTRLHNNANILCLAAANGSAQALEILEAFLKGDYEGGRHDRRLDKIKAMEV